MELGCRLGPACLHLLRSPSLAAHTGWRTCCCLARTYCRRSGGWQLCASLAPPAAAASWAPAARDLLPALTCWHATHACTCRAARQAVTHSIWSQASFDSDLEQCCLRLQGSTLGLPACLLACLPACSAACISARPPAPLQSCLRACLPHPARRPVMRCLVPETLCMCPPAPAFPALPSVVQPMPAGVRETFECLTELSSVLMDQASLKSRTELGKRLWAD